MRITLTIEIDAPPAAALAVGDHFRSEALSLFDRKSPPGNLSTGGAAVVYGVLHDVAAQLGAAASLEMQPTTQSTITTDANVGREPAPVDETGPRTLGDFGGAADGA